MRILLVTADSCVAPAIGYRIRCAFERLGNEVIPFNYRALHLNRLRAGRALISRRLCRIADKTSPDVLFSVKGESIPQGTIERIAKTGIKTACWTLDDPFGSENTANAIPTLKEYGSFFCFDSSYLPALCVQNPNSHVLPCAVDPNLHREIIPSSQRTEKYDIGFYGSHYPNRQVFLEQLADMPLTLAGFRWEEMTRRTPLADKTLPVRFNADKNIAGLTTLCKLFNETKINLNVHFTHSKHSPNLRTFEVLATNSFELCDDLPDLHRMFSVGKEIASFSDITECRKKIMYYLDNPQERRRISVAGRRRVLAEHTFVHRMRDALRAINKDQGN